MGWRDREPVRFARDMFYRYHRHDVGQQAAALAYYLLFALFPLLIFVSSLLGLLQMDVQGATEILAREGFMLHISKVSGSTLTAAQFNAFLNENTSLTSYVEFTHSKDAIAGFMLTLQNVFTSLLLAFVAILLLASMAVLSHSIGSTIEQDYTNMGILKTMGFTSGKLRSIQLLQYLITTLGGMGAGLLLSIPAAGLICQMTVTTTGLLIPSALPMGICLGVLASILLLLLGFVWLRTGKIHRIALRSKFEMRLCGRVFIIIAVYAGITEILVHIARQHVFCEFTGLSVVHT